MAADIKIKYGTSTAITLTAANSLANAAAAQSAVVSNTANLFLDALVQAIIASPTASTSSAGYVTIWVYASADAGTNYSQSASGSDAAITLTVPPNAKRIGTVSVVANSTTYKSMPFSVAAAFGGVLPEKWGIIVENQTGGTLPASGHSFFYQGILGQTV